MTDFVHSAQGNRTEPRVLRELVATTNQRLFSRCPYCGRHTYGRVCSAHRDLPQLDYQFPPAVPQPPADADTATPDPAPGVGTAAAASTPLAAAAPESLDANRFYRDYDRAVRRVGEAGSRGNVIPMRRGL